MYEAINELNPQPNDLVVVPEGMDVPADAPFMVHKMKFLHKPSIVRSGGFTMGFLDRFSFDNLVGWLGKMPMQPTFPIDQTASVPQTTTQRPTFTEVVPGSWIEPGGPQPVAGAQPSETVAAVPETQTQTEAQTKKSLENPKFFRYVRSHTLIPKLSGNATEINARGGVGFYIELDPANKTFAFSYALCHNKDNFSYDISRQISKGRFESDDWYEVQNYDADKSVVENISIAICNLLYNQNADKTKETTFSSLSEKFSYHDFKEIYKRI